MHTAYRALRRPHDWKMGLTSRYILQTRIWFEKSLWTWWRSKWSAQGSLQHDRRMQTEIESRIARERNKRSLANSNVRSMIHALTIVLQAFNYLRKMSKRFRTICSISFQLARARVCVWWNLSARYWAERKKTRLTIKLQYCAWRFAERFRYPITHTREQSWFNFSKGQRDIAEKRNGSCPILQVH